MPVALDSDEIGAKIIDGKELARSVRREIRRQVRETEIYPLALQWSKLGTSPASTVYVQQQGEGLSVCWFSFGGASNAGGDTAGSGN